MVNTKTKLSSAVPVQFSGKMFAKKDIQVSGTGGDFGQIQAGFDIEG